MGAGILPIARHNGEIYLLFSRERLIHSKDRDRGKWSDFGGSKEGNEIQYRTAVREGVEESSGILGDKRDVINLIKHHLVAKIHDKAYSIWIVEVEYEPDVVLAFHDHFKHALKHQLDNVKEHNGLFEKDKLQWIKLSNLHKKVRMFRPWYKRFIPKIIELLE
jgi:8-oxo-dGTP pyrophosphatase MutT (NUDIX family)